MGGAKCGLSYPCMSWVSFSSVFLRIYFLHLSAALFPSASLDLSLCCGITVTLFRSFLLHVLSTTVSAPFHFFLTVGFLSVVFFVLFPFLASLIYSHFCRFHVSLSGKLPFSIPLHLFLSLCLLLFPERVIASAGALLSNCDDCLTLVLWERWKCVFSDDHFVSVASIPQCRLLLAYAELL